MPENKVVIFDFDGVIVDSLSSAYATWTEAGATLTLDEYRARFDGNINHAYKPAPIDFHENYRSKVGALTIFPGISEAIKELSAEYTLVIVSSTLGEFINAVLKANNLQSYFDSILSNEIHTSKVEKFKMVFEKYKTTASNCVLITDTTGDMKEAGMVNLRAIGVTWGYQLAEILRTMNPVSLVNDPSKLAAEVKEFL